MDISPYLYAIQALKGQTPSEKKKELYSISQRIIENDDELLKFIDSNETDRVQPPLISYLRVIVGRKSMLNNVIIESLKSDDIRIINHALKAKWFFSSSNALICADYFRINILPFVSPTTNWKLIKTISRCLTNEPQRSKDFFDMLHREYSVWLALPFLIGFKERHIYETILLYKLVLTGKVLNDLFKKYPKIAIKYLQLGNTKKVGNKEDRQIHSIQLASYSYFLPKLVRHHTSEFIQLYDCLSYPTIKLGRKLAKYFIENATIILITKPKKFLRMLPLKVVTKTLSPQHFKTMFENLLPRSVSDFDIERIADYLQYYPQDKKMDLLEAKYHLLYNDEVFRNKRIIESPAFYELFSKQLKDKYRRQRIKSYGEKKNISDVLPCKLPPKICIPRLKKEIQKSPNSGTIVQNIEYMIISCSIYDSKDDLLEVLQYYSSNHKNQPAEVLLNLFDNITDQFDLTTLSKGHWILLRDLIVWAYERGDFQNALAEEVEVLFKATLYYFLKESDKEDVDEDDRAFLNKIIDIIIENFLEYDKTISFIYSETMELCRQCMQMFLLAIPRLYPLEHKVWKERRNKINITVYLIHSMLKFNSFFFPSISKRRNCNDNDKLSNLFTIADYPWLASFAEDLMKIKRNCVIDIAEVLLLCNFRESLQISDPVFYQKIIDEDPCLIYEVISLDAISVLRRSPRKILIKWELYLYACKKALRWECKFTKLFVAEIKWHQEIPVKFVQQCLTDIDDEGSIKVLEILLEKDELNRVYVEKLRRLVARKK